MYYAWKMHNMSPSVYYSLGCGEKKILGAFITKEIDEKNKEIEAMNSD